MAIPSDDSQPRLPDLLAAIEHLSETVERENALLVTGERSALSRLSADKRVAAGTYERIAGRIATHGLGGEPSNAIVHASLRHAMQRLERVSDENSRHLSAAISGHERLIETVRDAARSLDPATMRYTANGVVGQTKCVSAMAVCFSQAL
ncbi:MAG: hypothetical protein IPK66_03275 [Rhodospirillales bacterium]|nr:hypothetical protein [Rhodospirillales bacterium]